MKRDGEYIMIEWDGDPEAEYVRGHVAKEVALASIRVEGIRFVAPIVRHRYGRFFPRGYDSAFQLCDGPARGAFPLTEITGDRA